MTIREAYTATKESHHSTRASRIIDVGIVASPSHKFNLEVALLIGVGSEGKVAWQTKVFQSCTTIAEIVAAIYLMKASECKNFNHVTILEEDRLNQFFEVRSNEVSEPTAALTEVHILDPSKSRKRGTSNDDYIGRISNCSDNGYKRNK